MGLLIPVCCVTVAFMVIVHTGTFLYNIIYISTVLHDTREALTAWFLFYDALFYRSFTPFLDSVYNIYTGIQRD